MLLVYVPYLFVMNNSQETNHTNFKLIAAALVSFQIGRYLSMSTENLVKIRKRLGLNHKDFSLKLPTAKLDIKNKKIEWKMKHVELGKKYSIESTVYAGSIKEGLKINGLNNFVTGHAIIAASLPVVWLFTYWRAHNYLKNPNISENDIKTELRRLLVEDPIGKYFNSALNSSRNAYYYFLLLAEDFRANLRSINEKIKKLKPWQSTGENSSQMKDVKNKKFGFRFKTNRCSHLFSKIAL